MGKLSAWLAIAVGVAVGVAQAVRNYDNLDSWPTWAIDELAAVVLIVAGIRALQGKPTRALIVGWSFACGLYLSGFTGHAIQIQDLSAALQARATQMTIVVGGVLLASVVGLALVLLDRRATGNEKRPA